jgi:hypothetical protein
MSQPLLMLVSWKTRNSRWMSCPVMIHPRSEVIRSIARPTK